MKLLQLLGVSDAPAPRIGREFAVKIERKTPTTTVQFDATVHGFFVASRGRPDFVADQIIVDGIPDMNIRHFFPDELKQVKRYALSVELPKALHRKM